MNRIKKIVSILLVGCFLVSLTGCALIDNINEMLTEESVGVGIENNPTTEVSNSISVGIIDFDTFNPLLTKSETVKESLEFVFEPLFDVNERMQPVPVLAESYTVSPDGRTININLRDNVLWHDGTAFTAYDVAYTIKQIRSGITNYTDALANIADYMATGDHSLQIVLNYVVPNFVSLLTFPIVKFQSAMTMNENYIPNGTGPYRYETELSTTKISFIAFDHYRNGKASINNVYVCTVPDLLKYESMFEASEIDLMTGETVDLSEYTPRGSATNNEYVTNKMTFIGYNFRNKTLWGADTRKGLTELIDKDDIVNSAIYSRGVACDLPINPSSIYYYDTNTKFKRDETMATNFLGNDGWGINEDGKYTRVVDGKKQVLGFDILTNADSHEKVTIANKIAEDFNDYGIGATVIALTYEEYTAKINAKDYDIMIGEIEIGANLDLTPLVSSADNYFSYRNTDLDMLAGQMGLTQDEEQLKMLFIQYGNTIMNDMPFSALFFRKGDVLSSSKIKTEIVPTVGRLYRNTETWRVTQ